MYNMLKKPLGTELHRGLRGKDTCSEYNLLDHKFPESNPTSQKICCCSGRKNAIYQISILYVGNLHSMSEISAEIVLFAVISCFVE